MDFDLPFVGGVGGALAAIFRIVVAFVSSFTIAIAIAKLRRNFSFAICDKNSKSQNRNFFLLNKASKLGKKILKH